MHLENNDLLAQTLGSRNIVKCNSPNKFLKPFTIDDTVTCRTFSRTSLYKMVAVKENNI